MGTRVTEETQYHTGNEDKQDAEPSESMGSTLASKIRPDVPAAQDAFHEARMLSPEERTNAVAQVADSEPDQTPSVAAALQTSNLSANLNNNCSF